MRFLALLLVLFAHAAEAGPWPRAKGELYVLVAHQGGGDGWTGLFAEYGGPFGLTYGIDAGGRVVGLPELMQTGFTDRDVEGRVRSFVRVPVPLPKGERVPDWLSPWLAAVELSVGRDFEDDGTGPMRYGIAATVGRGFSTPLGDGWTVFDIGTSFASDDAERRTGLAFTLGIKPWRQLAVELQAFAEIEGNASYQIGPTFQYGFGKLGAARLGLAFRSEQSPAVSVGWSRTF